jgi:hypothetical protein
MNLQAHLRSKIFAALQDCANKKQYQATNFTMKRPQAANKIKSDPEAYLISLLIGEYIQQ